jgi:hypothetical protein
VPVSSYAEPRFGYDDEYERRVALVFVERLVREGYSEREIASEVERFWTEGGAVRNERASRIDRLRANRGLFLF